jgi:hypothetical protein
LIPTVATGLLLLVIHELPQSISYILRARISQWIGAASYPLYLWHWPALVLPLYIIQHPLSTIQRILFIGLTFALAALTHHVIENPLRHIKTSSRSVFSIAAVATLVSVVVGASIAISSAQNLKLAPISTPISLKQVTRTPVIYADGCQLDKIATTSPPCEYGDIQGSKTIVLFGDSHAAQWFPTLNTIALNKNLKLIVLTKSSCPAANVTLPDLGAFRNGPCKKWRENSLLRIERMHPWAVFISSYDHYQTSTNISELIQWWRAGYVDTVNRIQLATNQVILLADTPRPSRDIPSCLIQNRRSKCLTSRPTSLFNLAGLGKGLYVDPTNWFCSQSCPPIINNIVVYRDASHMSVDFALHLVPALTKILIAQRLISS